MMVGLVFLGALLGFLAGAIALISGAGVLAALGAYALTGSASTLGMAVTSTLGCAIRDRLVAA